MILHVLLPDEGVAWVHMHVPGDSRNPLEPCSMENEHTGMTAGIYIQRQAFPGSPQREGYFR